MTRNFPPDILQIIYNYYDCGKLICQSDTSYQELYEACEYFRIPCDTSTVRSKNFVNVLNNLSNIGATNMFSAFVDEFLMRALQPIILNGGREATLIVWKDDDKVDWVGSDHPEGLNHFTNFIHIFTTKYAKFFKYYENRNIACCYLEGSGLQKVRVDVDNYPSMKDSPKSGKDQEVRYIFKQRPYISFSWENQIHNKHVQFNENFN